MTTIFRNTLIGAAFVFAPVALAGNTNNPTGGEDKILRAKQALIKACQNSPRCMTENGYRLFSTAPVTFEPARTLAEYNNAFHSMQEVREAIKVEEKLRAQWGNP